MRRQVVRRLIGAAGLIVVMAASLMAAGFWDDKPFTTWSDMELQQILADSPWSRPLAASFNAVDPERQLTVTWRTALPMKQALIRGQIGENGTVPPAAQEILSRTEEVYGVSVAGLPVSITPFFDAAKEATFLLREGKPPVPAEGLLSTPQPDDTYLLVAIFPKTDAIVLGDQEVEFVTTLGGIQIRRKFLLKEMVFNGQLEL